MTASCAASTRGVTFVVTSLAAECAVAAADPARSEAVFAAEEDAARTSAAVGVTAGLEAGAAGAETAGVDETTGAGVDETTGAGVDTTGAGVVGKAGAEAGGVVADAAGMAGRPACAASANAAAEAMTPPSTSIRSSTFRIAADLAVSLSNFKRT